MSSLRRRGPEPRLDNQSPELFGQTPSQTVGPFFHHSLPWEGGADLVGKLDPSAPSGVPCGEVIDLRGRVLDGRGAAVPDAMLEIWQANAAGRYASLADRRDDIPLDPLFIGFGRTATGTDGEFQFRTVRPGCVPAPDGSLQAPHIALSVFGRGLLKRLVTRIYFADSIGNDADPILASVPAQRRATLIAQRHDNGWRLDIVLQGPGETVFFAL
jgi:protocatechuate 3,4-dioxygenase, alpha subunit